jgi:hypothetical protein
MLASTIYEQCATNSCGGYRFGTAGRINALRTRYGVHGSPARGR